MDRNLARLFDCFSQHIRLAATLGSDAAISLPSSASSIVREFKQDSSLVVMCVTDC